MADGAGILASGTEVYAGVRAGEPEHVVAGTVSIVTVGTSRTLTSAYARQFRGQGIVPDRLERGVVYITFEAAPSAVSFLTNFASTAYSDLEHSLVSMPRFN